MSKRTPIPRWTILLALLGLLATACGDTIEPPAGAGSERRAEEPAEPEVTPTPEPAPGRIRFLEGFEAGVEAAESDDDLVFVYVGRHHPH